MRNFFILFLGLLSVFLFPKATQAAPFDPQGNPGTNIGTQLERGYEPSGIIWHNRLQSLFTVWDNGYVTQLDLDGRILHQSVFVGGDLEGITVVDDQSNYIYLLVEYPQKIVEFDISTWTKTGKTWELQNMPGNRRDGAEALTYNSDKRLFYVGSQLNGQIYVYDIDLSTSGQVGNPRIIPTNINYDLAGLYYSTETKTTYALFDRDNKIQEYNNDDNLVRQFDAPGINQEGLALLPGCPNNTTTIIITEDMNPADPYLTGQIKKYNNYPISCPADEDNSLPTNPPQPADPPVDQDQDGSQVETDCNDNDARVHPNQNEIPNDGLDNDCNTATPDWTRAYTAAGITPYPTTEVRGDYHVFDNKWEFSYIRLPAQPVAGWYAFDLEAKATAVDALYNLGIYVRNAEERFTKTKIVDDVNFKAYRFYYYIPANMPTEVRFISGVRGVDATGAKREHHLRTVAITRVEQANASMSAPNVVNLTKTEGANKIIATVETDINASANLTVNGILMTDTDLTSSKTWTVRNLSCGKTYQYELKLYSDWYSPVLNNAVVQTGNFTTAPCL